MGRIQKRRLKVGDVCDDEFGDRCTVAEHQRRWTNPWLCRRSKDGARHAYKRDQLTLVERDGRPISDEIEAES